ncbi:MAG: IS1634 family transposase [Chloroflexi bacterium]|nr:IS1634 family transposase [Chloroflexota bacterium]
MSILYIKSSLSPFSPTGLPLAVTRSLGLPLLHKVYCGSTHDAKLFPKVIPALIDRWLKLSRGAGKIILVFDKGNNSHPNLELLEKRPEVSFICSLVPSQHKDLLRVDFSNYQDLPLPAESGEEEPLKAYRTQKEVFGANRTVVVTYNAALYRKKCYSQQKHLEKAQAALEEVNWAKVKKPSQKVQLLLAHYRVQGLLKVTLPQKSHHKVRTANNWYRIYRHRRLFFGKTILFTDRDELSTDEIVSLYRGKNTVEDYFKRMHDPTSISFTPMYHWTDQKIRVHAFICVLGLLLLRLLEFKASVDKKTLMSIPALLEELSDIKEAIVLQGDMSTSCMISHCSSVQKKLAQTYGLERVAEQLGEQPTRLRILWGGSPQPSIARFGRLAFPKLGKVTTRVLLGRNSHGCPV